MFANLKYKTKLYLLLAGGLLGIIIIYQVAIKETVSLREEINQNENKARELADAPKQLARLQDELATFTKGISSVTGENEKFRELLLEQTTNYCHTLGLTLRDFPQAHTYNETDYTVRTYSLIAEGNFLELQKLAYLLETGFCKGKVPSAQYYVKTDFKTGRKSLFIKLYIQYIVKNERNEKEFSQE